MSQAANAAAMERIPVAVDPIAVIEASGLFR